MADTFHDDYDPILDRCHLQHTLTAVAVDHASLARTRSTSTNVTLCTLPKHIQMREPDDTFTTEEAHSVCRYVDRLKQLIDAGKLKNARCAVCQWEWFTTRVEVEEGMLRCESCRVEGS